MDSYIFNRVTGGGVTAGIDFALVLAAELLGDDEARKIQLAIEYDPKPPFEAGSPEMAGSALAEQLRTAARAGREERRVAVVRAVVALSGPDSNG